MAIRNLVSTGLRKAVPYALTAVLLGAGAYQAHPTLFKEESRQVGEDYQFWKKLTINTLKDFPDGSAEENLDCRLENFYSTALDLTHKVDQNLATPQKEQALATFRNYLNQAPECMPQGDMNLLRNYDIVASNPQVAEGVKDFDDAPFQFYSSLGLLILGFVGGIKLYTRRLNRKEN